MKRICKMKQLCCFAFTIFLMQMMLLPVFAADNRVFDDAGLLSDEEITRANEMISHIIDTYQCDVVVVTTNDSEGKSAMDYADDYFDYNGFGIGAERDGVLLSINMDIRECWISTSGQTILELSDSEIDSMLDSLASYLGDGSYGNGVITWLEDVEYELRTDDGTGYVKQKQNPFVLALYSLGQSFIIGLVIAGIIVLIMIRKCKTAVKPALANEYVNRDSFVVSRSEDRFLRTHTTQVKIQTSSGSSGSHRSGGSSVHRSSSGRSHGGGGRRF